jgi:hypothetical protein
MSIENLPVSVMEELELACGVSLDKLFDDKKRHPYSNRATVFLSLHQKGEPKSWDELGKLTMDQLFALFTEASQDDPKE